jgi:protein-L-isoaspartate(D-aspartate) O-methyltransferase
MSSTRPPSNPPSSRSRNTPEKRLREVLAEVPRSAFVAPATEDPQGYGLPPVIDGTPLPEAVIASMLGALALTGSERVLDVGSSSAYTAALLSRLARQVISMESNTERADGRIRQLAALGGCQNVEVVVGLAQAGHGERAPYQAILVGGGVGEIPHALLDQLEPGGRLVIALGNAEGQLLELVRKRPDGIVSEALCPCYLPMVAERRHRHSSFPWADEEET